MRGSAGAQNLQLIFPALKRCGLISSRKTSARAADRIVDVGVDVAHDRGAWRWSEADSAKHYKNARGEPMESAASLDLLRLRRLVTSERCERGIKLLEAVVAMLSKMI